MNLVLELVIYLAIAVVLTFFMYNLSILLYCLYHGVRVEQFQMFFSIKNAHLTNFNMNHTNFRVGVIPVNSHVKIHGMADELIEYESVDNSMLISKPKRIQNLVNIFPIIIMCLCFLSLLFFINTSKSIIDNLWQSIDCFMVLYKAFVGNLSAKAAFLEWISLKEDNNAFILILVTVILTNIFSSILSYILNSTFNKVPEKYSKIMLIILSILIIALVVLFVKFFYAAFNVFSVSNTCLMILTFIVTSYIVAIILTQSLRVLPKQKFI